MGDVKSEGQAITQALNGRLSFEEGNNRIIGRDESNVIRLSIDANNGFAVQFFDSNGILVSSYDSTGLKYYDSSGHVLSTNDLTGQSYYDASGNLLASNTPAGLIFYDSNQVARAIFALSGIKIAQTGIDVLTATVSQLVFNSANNLFKIVKSGTASLDVPDPFTAGSSVSATIPHGLSITPAFLAFVNIPAGSGVYGTGLGQVPAFTMGGGWVTSYVQGNVDSTNLIIKVTNVFGAGLTGAPFGQSWGVRYYILQETAN